MSLTHSLSIRARTANTTINPCRPTIVGAPQHTLQCTLIAHNHNLFLTPHLRQHMRLLLPCHWSTRQKRTTKKIMVPHHLHAPSLHPRHRQRTNTSASLPSQICLYQNLHPNILPHVHPLRQHTQHLHQHTCTLYMSRLPLLPLL
jgi:hypothetical protein